LKKKTVNAKSKTSSYKTRLRPKGQLTLPSQVRELLKVSEGSDIEFYRNDIGQVVIQGVQTIAPDQAWFWTERWQKMEHQAQADLEAGRVSEYENADDTVAALMRKAHDQDPHHGNV
jgi:bifunctional DNA-binding transcriptional regulator/antitoxin component of YhaV-PrlF toxin-antitoxin module